MQNKHMELSNLAILNQSKVSFNIHLSMIYLYPIVDRFKYIIECSLY